MKKKFASLTLMAVAFAAVTVTVVSCKDSDFEYQIQQQLDENSTLDEALRAQVSTLEQLLQSVQSEQSVMQGLVDGNQVDIATAQAAIGVLEDAMDGINEALKANGFESMNNLAAEVVGIMQAYDDLKDQVMENKDDISGLSSTVETLSSQLVEIGDVLADQSTTITQLLTDTKYAAELAKADSVRIDALEGDLDEVKSDIETIKQQADDNLAAAKGYADDVVDALLGEGFSYETLGDFEAAVNTQLEDLPEIKQGLSDLAVDVADLSDKLDELTSKVDALTKNVDAIANYLAKQVTSILVQATVNPVFGTFAAPMNVNSNVLATFFGKVTDDDLKFPTASQKYYADIDNGPYLTSADLDMLGLSEKQLEGITDDGYIINEKEGNAGTLYVTVNPNTVDFTGLKFGMENSVQEESKVTLGALTPSDYKISFGYTRSDVSNGFYEAPATLTAAHINEDIDMGVAVEELKDAINLLTDYISGGSLNVADILTSLYQDMTSVLDADAIYAQWTDDADDVDEPQTHRTYSQYSIAATGVKPLSYAFMIDANYETFPGISRIENLINNMFEKINIPTFDLSKYQFSKIEHIEAGNDSVTLTGEITLDASDLVAGQTVNVYDDEGNVIGTGTFDGSSNYVTVEVTIKMAEADFMGDTVADINSIIDSINNSLGEINNMLADLEQLNEISSSIGELEEQLISYIDRLNNQLCKMINSVNSTLQPILLVNTTDGFTKLSQMRSNPSVLSSGDNINILPTSFTAEILAPAYKKLVGVTNVYSLSNLNTSAQNNNYTCKRLLDKANSSNENLATVVDGDLQTLSISGLEPGYIYELVYSAVDYSGKVVAEKFYVRVAE